MKITVTQLFCKAADMTVVERTKQWGAAEWHTQVWDSQHWRRIAVKASTSSCIKDILQVSVLAT